MGRPYEKQLVDESDGVAAIDDASRRILKALRITKDRTFNSMNEEDAVSHEAAPRQSRCLFDEFTEVVIRVVRRALRDHSSGRRSLVWRRDPNDTFDRAG